MRHWPITSLLTIFAAGTAAAADCRLNPSQVELWPEIERQKVWRPVLVCDGATIDTAVPRSDAWDHYQQMCSWLSDSDIAVNDLQIVISDRNAIGHLDGLTRKNMADYHYTPNWDLMRDHQPTGHRDDADELIIRGNSPARIWHAAGLGDFYFGTDVPTYHNALTEPFFFDAQAPGPAAITKSRVTVSREKSDVYVTLYRFRPIREIATHTFHNCRHP